MGSFVVEVLHTNVQYLLLMAIQHLQLVKQQQRFVLKKQVHSSNKKQKLLKQALEKINTPQIC